MYRVEFWHRVKYREIKLNANYYYLHMLLQIYTKLTVRTDKTRVD